MAHHFLTSASFTVAFAMINGSIHLLLGISVKKREDGLVPEAKLKCPGGCTEDADTLWKHLADTILPETIRSAVFSPSASKCSIEAAVCDRLIELGVPAADAVPYAVTDAIVRIAVSHREFYAETGNRLPDVAKIVRLCDFATPISRGRRLQGWQYAIIDPSKFDVGAQREEAAEMLPFAWYPLQKSLSGFVDGVKLIPMHWSAIAKSADLACRLLKEEAQGNSESAELYKAFGESLAWGLNGRASGKALGEEIDRRLADREPGL